MDPVKKFTALVGASLLVFCSLQAFAADAAPVDDASITKSVKSQIQSSNVLSSSTVSVSTKNGVVTLTGNLRTDDQASEAIQIAQSTPGVSDVDTTALKVETSTQPFSDTVITAKVKGMFVKEKLFGDKPIAMTGITVETTNGIVYLTGIVDTAMQATTASQLAKSISGVKSVDSKITVKGTESN